MITVEIDRQRRRVWVCGRRCHHGLVGAGLAAGGAVIPGAAGPVLFGLGIALIVDDWRDAPWLPAARTEPVVLPT